jgi:hypothetical protein
MRARRRPGPADCCENAGMDEMRVKPDEDQPIPPTTMSRRSFFGRTLAVAGAGAALLTLTGCPGGDQDDDDDDEDDD